MRELRLFLWAVQFLTRLPVPAQPDHEADWTVRSARYFPLAGQIVGGLAAAAFWAAAQVWSGWIAALLAIAVGILVTGALHEDGLADTADGLAGGGDRSRRLAIMKDSRTGTYGVLALVLAVGLKAGALAALSPLVAVAALVAAHGAARAAAVLAMTLPYAGDREAAKWTPERPRGFELVMALAFAAWPLAFLPAASAGLGLLLGTGLALVPALLARRLIGGQTGDVLGAAEQAFEVGFLLGVAIIVQS